MIMTKLQQLQRGKNDTTASLDFPAEEGITG